MSFMKKKSGLPVLVQFFISHFVLILVFVVGLLFINMSYSNILHRVVADTAQQELRKSAEQMQTRLDELQSSAFSLAREDAIGQFSAAPRIGVEELALVYKLNQRVLASYSNNQLVSSAMVYFVNSGSAWVNQSFLDNGLVQAAGKDYRINNLPFEAFFQARRQDRRISCMEMAHVSLLGAEREQLIVSFDLYPLSNFKNRAYAAFLLNMEQVNGLLSSSPGNNESGLFYILDASGSPVFVRSGSEDVYPQDEAPQADMLSENKDHILFSCQPEASAYTYYLSLPTSYISSQVWAGQRPSLFVAIAAFLLALGGGVRVSGLRPDSLQGDRVCREMLRRLEHPGAVLDLSACPDLGPVLFAAAARRCGGVFTGTRRLRIKESDRAAAMAQELAKFGAQVTVEEDCVTVLPRPLHAPNEELDGHNDHRIVMAMAVLCASLGGTIRGAEAVNKSYPDFFRTLRALGLRMDVRP